MGVIYLITCNKCNKNYIGETKREINKRFKEHIKNILNFKNNLYNSLINYDKQSETTLHFNCSKHILNEDLDFYILINSLNSDSIRKSKETDLIHYFRALKKSILNNKIPNQNYITNLFFYKYSLILP